MSIKHAITAAAFVALSAPAYSESVEQRLRRHECEHWQELWTKWSVELKRKFDVSYLELIADKKQENVKGEGVRLVVSRSRQLETQIRSGFVSECEVLGYYMVPSFRTDQ